MPEETKDVEMKDASKADDKDGKDGKKEEKKEPEKPKTPKQIMTETIIENFQIMISAVNTGDHRIVNRVLRSINSFRRLGMKSDVLVAFIDAVVDAKSPLKELLKSSIDGMTMSDDVCKAEDFKLPKDLKLAQPEAEVYLGVLSVVLLLDAKEYDKTLKCSTALVSFLQGYNRRSLDALNARVFFYHSRIYELKGQITEVREELLKAYRTACLHHDQMGQATLLNLCIRNYLVCNLVEQAWKLVSKTSFPESRPQAQYARYLYYIGRIKAIRLEYSDAHSKLMQAIRKAPQASKVALGFKLAAHKLAIIVELLMGGIPERTTFTQEGLREALLPYFAITQAVRTGDLKEFTAQMDKYEALFKKDKTFTLINRLRYNVIKSGLRSINMSYSRISLQDICSKLGLESPQDAAGVVAKAVVDGVIEATINHEGQFVQSNPRTNLYSSAEPQKSLHKRVAFCLQLHNDAIKAMAYPDKEGVDGKGLTAEERRNREKQNLADIDDMDDDL